MMAITKRLTWAVSLVNQHRRATVSILGVSVLIAVVAGFVTWVVRTEGTGFSGNDLVDWLDLLLIPVVLALGVLVVNWATQRRQMQLARDENETDRQIAADRNNEETLRHYQDAMERLLLERKLNSPPGRASGEATIAEARTRSALRTLDPIRKGLLLQFIHEAHLINSDHPILTLALADASAAELNYANLIGSNFSSTNLRSAKLRGADLTEAIFSKSNMRWTILRLAKLVDADLSWADLTGANLNAADLRGASLRATVLKRANLRAADLAGADLTGADLTGADLTGAKGLTYKQLREASSPEGDYIYSPDLVAQK